jgi:hypothetical protein
VEMKNDCVIYDFETLGQDQKKSVVLSMAALAFTESRFLSDNPYTYEELLYSSKYIKFNAQDQVYNYKRTIDNSTLEWWTKQPAEARKALKPSSEDVLIVELYPFVMDLVNEPSKIKKVYTRGNTFDPMILQYLLEDIGKKDPFPWWSVRDTRSMIEGMSYGSDIINKFIPEGLEKVFVQHDPIHDISMDIMRLQTLARVLIL